MGVLYRTDSKALAAYCVCYARWRQAELRVAKEGQVVEEPVLARIGTSDDLTVVGHRLKHHPATIITREMAHEMRAFLIEFGMTRSEEHTSELQSLRHLVC